MEALAVDHDTVCVQILVKSSMGLDCALLNLVCKASGDVSSPQQLG